MKSQNHTMRFTKLLFKVIFFSCSFCLSAQTKKELKNQKLKIEKEIIYTTELLNKTKSNKTKSLNYLKVLDAQLKSKENLVSTLNIEISLLEKQIRKTEGSILELEREIIKEEKELISLKEEYAKMIYAAFKQKGKRNNMMFILSSDDFNQAYKRVLYLKQYSVFRKKQAIKIEETQENITKKKKNLKLQKEWLIEESFKKNKVAQTKKIEFESIKKQKTKKNELVKKLVKSENLFKNQLLDKKKKANDLDKRIRKIIKEEIAKARNKNSDFELTPEAMALSTEFNNNKGKLPWPLEKGVIVGGYGVQKHLVFNEVETFNNGIDIATDKNADVRVVFDGIISRIFFIKGEGRAVLVNHGEYYTVYSGLKDVAVKVGDKLFSKEKIGVVSTNKDDNKTELHFEIWKGYDKHNPSNWLFNAY